MKIDAHHFINQANELAKSNQITTESNNASIEFNNHHAKSVIHDLVASHKKMYGSQSVLSELQTKKNGIEELIHLYKEKQDSQSFDLFNLRVQLNSVVERTQFGGRKLLQDFVRQNQSQALSNNPRPFYQLLVDYLKDTEDEIKGRFEDFQKIVISQQNLLSLNLINSDEAKDIVSSIDKSINTFKEIHTTKTSYWQGDLIG